MNKKRFLASVMTVAVMGSIFTGCGKKEVTAQISAQPITIKVSTWTDEMEEMAEIKKQFEAENEDIKVEIMEFPSEEYKDKLVIQLAGGADIDVISHKNTAEYADVASKKQLLNLEELVKKDAVDIAPYGPLYEGLKIEGELCGMPYRKTAWVVFYNKDLFDAAGVSYPTDDMTWGDFKEIAKKMTSGSDNSKIAGAYLHTWPQTWYGMGLQKGATIIDEDLTPFKEGLQYRMDLEADGSIMKYTDAVATKAHYKTEFAKGQTAMNIIGDFHIAQLRELEKSGEVKFNWDIAAMPHPEGVAANTTWGTANPISINIKSDKQDAAWKFVRFVSGEKGSKIYAENGNLPAYSNEVVEKAYIGEGKQNPANIGILSQAKVYLENPAIQGAGIVKDEIYAREAQLTFAGERNVEETFKVIESRIKEQLK